MAYKIGSEKGKKIAKDLAIGGTYKASDGSTWKKEKDGSVSVTTSNGQKFDNAYKSDDHSVTLRQQMDAGVPHSYVQSTLNDRNQKIRNDPNLHQFYFDDIHNEALDYISSGKATDYRKNAKDDFYDFMYEFMRDNRQPTEPKSDPRIDEMLNQILNRDKFSYDVTTDPLYQQYAQMYQREGDRATREAMADAAAMAGGMNTYAMTAAQQANNYYSSKLNDVIPELYNLAYDKYLKDIDLQVQNLGILQNMDDRQYARYRDTMNDWYNDKNFAYGAYQDAITQSNWEKNFDYNSMINNRDFINNNFLADREYNANRADKDLANDRYEREKAKEQILWDIQMGMTTFDPALIAKSDMSQAEIDAAIATKNSENTRSVSTYNSPYISDVPIVDPKPTTTEKVGNVGNGAPLVGKGFSTEATFEAEVDAIYQTKGKEITLNALNEALVTGVISMSEYMKLKNKYSG